MGGFEASLCAWAAGGAVIFGPRTPGELADRLPQLAPGALAGAPVQLQLLLDALPDGWLPMPGMRVGLFGAHIPVDLQREIALRLSSDVLNLYGSTEAGLMAWASTARLAEPTAVGFVAPWIDLEVVDGDGEPCAPETTGVLRVRGAGVARCYLGDDAATRAHFRDGWFYPGDTGLLTPGGVLHLHGRTTEVINLGGSKVLPLLLEDAARRDALVRDAAAFMAPGKDGADAAWLAIVATGKIDELALLESLRRIGAATINVAQVPHIPRNPRGKILRDQLRRSVIQSTTKAL